MYWFDKCPKEKVDEIGKLCLELGMQDCEMGSPEPRQWLGEEGEIGLVGYDPELKCPLKVQTWPPYNHTNPTVRGLLKKLADLTGAQIYEDYNQRIKLDMGCLR